MKKLTDRDYWRTHPLTVEDALGVAGRDQVVLDVCVEKPEYSHGLECITEAENAFVTQWSTKVDKSVANPLIWCNPPYSQKQEFIDLCARGAMLTGVPVMVLIPFAPTTAWWLDSVVAYNAEVFIPNGRICFIDHKTGVLERSPKIATALVLLTPERLSDMNETVAYSHYIRRQEWLG